MNPIHLLKILITLLITPAMLVGCGEAFDISLLRR